MSRNSYPVLCLFVTRFDARPKVGQSLDVRGPVGRFKYAKNAYRHIGLVAGGTGITPCLQLVRCVLEGPDVSVPS